MAADVLNFLPAEVRAEVIQRVASLETVQPSAMEELESIMKAQFSNNSSAKSSSFGGVKAAAKIMNFVKVDIESKLMGGLVEMDPDIAQRIQPVIAAPIGQSERPILQAGNKARRIAAWRGMRAVMADGGENTKRAGGDKGARRIIQPGRDLFQCPLAWGLIMLRQGFQAGNGEGIGGGVMVHCHTLPKPSAWRHPFRRI